MKYMDCLLLQVILILIINIQRQIVCFILTLRGKKLNVIIPDFALDNNGDKSKYLQQNGGWHIPFFQFRVSISLRKRKKVYLIEKAC